MLMPTDVASEPTVVRLTRNAPSRIAGHTSYPSVRNAASVMPVGAHTPVALACTKASRSPSLPATTYTTVRASSTPSRRSTRDPLTPSPPCLLEPANPGARVLGLREPQRAARVRQQVLRLERRIPHVANRHVARPQRRGRIETRQPLRQLHRPFRVDRRRNDREFRRAQAADRVRLPAPGRVHMGKLVPLLACWRESHARQACTMMKRLQGHFPGTVRQAPEVVQPALLVAQMLEPRTVRFALGEHKRV